MPTPIEHIPPALRDPQLEREPEDDEPIRELEIPLGYSTLRLTEYGNGDVSVANGSDFTLIDGDHLYAVAEFLIGKRAASMAAARLEAKTETMLASLPG